MSAKHPSFENLVKVGRFDLGRGGRVKLVSAPRWYGGIISLAMHRNRQPTSGR
jgi:hypothetical protein